MKKTILALGILALAAAALYTQRGPLAERVIAHLAPAMMSANTLATLEDGLHVAVCGAGGPMPDAVRSGPCLAISAGERLLVIDAGSNGVRNLVRMRYPVGAIEAVFLTHFHSDHIDGLGELATLRWVQGSHQDPLPVYGPTGVEQVVDGFNRAYALDVRYRTAHHGEAVVPLRGAGMRAHSLGPGGGGKLRAINLGGDLKVTAFRVDHDPASPALGYRVDYRGRSLVVSGDTIKSEAVAQQAQNVDLLVHEALSPELVMIINSAAETTGNSGMAQIALDILDYHASPVEAAEVARDAGAGHLLFYHIVPALPPIPGAEAAWLQGVADIFSAHTLARDGTTVSLPANSDAIKVGRHRL
ncbi:MBL fold metallo-hydrolase [Haliea sp. E1-2-M8]|uniref:MBL fold metallo-hydrolase n=1 Tax=Haliea sp. E1-2-M8 TaxID=3064706 RepID=UPI002727FB17|nr:MBL fold metallo-hydrolase [Haliea sp. E1-2-M8]MDO8863442.1 MBL fold metallo-hydrolase [Haliea sp. E1-2-M8]